MREIWVCVWGGVQVPENSVQISIESLNEVLEKRKASSGHEIDGN